MPNLLERALPTIGSIGGGILGGLGAGAADVASLGAAAPLVNPITGAIAGSAVGEAAGKAGQNFFEHQGIGNGVVGAGVQGAVSQAAGEGAGALIGKGGSALLDLAAGKAAKATAEKTAQDAAQKTADEAGQKIAGLTENASPEELANNTAQRYKVNLPGAEDEGNQAVTLLQNHGLNDPNNVAAHSMGVGNAVAQPIQDAMKDAALKAPGSKSIPINKNFFKDFVSSVKKKAGPLGNTGYQDENGAAITFGNNESNSTPNIVNHASRLTGGVKRALQSTGIKLDPKTNAIKGPVSAQQASDFLSQMKTLTDQEWGRALDASGNPTNYVDSATRKVTSGLYSDAQDQMEKALYDRPGVAQGVKRGSDDIYQQTRDALDAHGITDPAVQDSVIGKTTDILGSKTAGDMRAGISPYVRTARIGKSATTRMASSTQAQAAKTALEKNISDAETGRAVKTATREKAEATAEAKPAGESLADKFNPFGNTKAALTEGATLSAFHPALGLPLLGLGAIQAAKNASPEALSAVGRPLAAAGTPTGMGVLGGLTSGTAALGTQGGAPGIPLGATSPTSNITGASMPPTGAPQGGMPSSTGVASPNPFLSLIPGSGVSSAYQPIAQNEMVSMFDPSLLGTTQPGANAAASQISDKQQALQQTMSLINSLKTDQQAAGGAQGKLGGILSTLQGRASGGAAGSYKAEADTAASQIASTTGLNADEIKQYIPQLTDTQGVADQKINALTRLVQSTGYSSSPSTLGSLAPAS